MPHTVPRVGRSYEHFPDGFELHLLQTFGMGLPSVHKDEAGGQALRSYQGDTLDKTPDKDKLVLLANLAFFSEPPPPFSRVVSRTNLSRSPGSLYRTPSPSPTSHEHGRLPHMYRGTCEACRPYLGGGSRGGSCLLSVQKTAPPLEPPYDPRDIPCVGA